MNIKTTFAVATLLTATAFSLPAFAGNHGGDRHGAKIEKILAEFPAEKRDMIRESFKEGKAQREASKEEASKYKEAMRDALKAEKFDESAFRSNAAKIDVLKSKSMKNMNDRIVDIAKQLNAEERQTLVKMLKDGKRGGKKGGHGHDHK